MNAGFSRNCKFGRMFVNILSIIVILAVAFPTTGIASAQESNPRIVASITHNWFRAEQFSPSATLHVKIYNEPGGTLLWEENRTTDDTGFSFIGQWEHPVDLKPGNYLALSDASITKELILEAVTLDVVDPSTDYLAGTAPPAVDGRLVWVGTGNADYGCSMEVTADPISGAWAADFSTQPCDVTDDMWTAAQVFDADGDASEGNLPLVPFFTVFPEWEAVEGWDWTQDATIHLEIDDPDTPESPDYSQDADVVPTPWNPNEIWVRFDFAGVYDVKPGDQVTLSEGVTSQTHTVRNLAVTSMDKDANTVTGTADTGTQVHVWPHGYDEVLATTGDDGIWLANFDAISLDLVEGMSGRSEIRDEMRNATAVDWHIPKPRMVIFPEWEWLDGLDWPDGPVDISVAGKPECATTKESQGGFFNGNFGEGCDVVVGDQVTLDDGATTRTHIVLNLAVTEVNEAADIVAGTADEGATVYVWPHATGQTLQATADPDGNWQVDFTGTFDMVPGEAGRSQIYDEFENATAVDWNVPWPPSTFVVNTTDDNDDGTCDETHCSLREAINIANARTAADTIAFNIPGEPPFTIQPQPGYPDLHDTITIDGTTQPGFEGTPLIELDGTHAGADANGLVVAASDSSVKGLVINRFSGNGIVVFGRRNTIEGNYIGIDVTGTTTAGLEGPGVGEYTVTLMNEGCPTYPVGTNFDGFISESDDPLQPWSGISVQFKGTDECGSPETLGAASLIYRYKLEFAEPTQLSSISVSGAAFNGPDSVLRVLDENMNVLGTANTFGGNSFQTPSVRLADVTGTIFYIDEFDTSSTWRFRQSIVINGPRPLGNYGNGVLLVGGATDNLVVDNLISGNMSNGVGIFNPGTTGNTVQENYIGTDVTGQQSLGNAGSGVGIGDQAYDNFIIGNLISGNRSDGVGISDPGTNGNTLQGNNIGTAVGGMTALPNEGVGVWIGNGAADTIVGGTDPSMRNLISGNRWGGVSINHLETTATQVLGNYIGTDQGGELALPNGGDGVYVSGSQTVVGSTEPGAGNLISGNLGSGIGIRDAGSGNLVQGNYIGTDPKGMSMTSPTGPAVGPYTLTVMPGTCPTYAAGTDFDGFISESDDPIALSTGMAVHFLGTDAGCGSPERIGAASLIYRYRLEFDEDTQLSSILVSGAAFNGPDSVLRVLDENMNVLGLVSTAGGNSFRTPYVVLPGVVGQVFYVDEFDTSGQWRFRQNIVINGPLPLGNQGDGVTIGNSPDSTIERNVISGNMASGISLWGSNSMGNVMRGNRIGTDSAGTAALPNGDGVWLGDSASNNMVGGTTDDARNVISGNNIFGVSINNPGTMGNLVQGNYIGTDFYGTAGLPNGLGGVILTLGTSQNRIGGTDAGAGNLISGNNGDGVTIVEGGTSENIVQGNFIGTDVTGMVALSNSVRGVFIAGGATDNLVGGTEENAGNLISGNGAAGIRITDGGTAGNQVQGNLIGTDFTGTNPLANGYVGVRFSDGAADNVIGGTEPGAGNIIAFNTSSGIATNLEAGSGNSMLSNLIFSNGFLGIDLGEDDVTANDPLDLDAGPNDLQNFPSITAVTRKNTSLLIVGSLRSTPRTAFRLEIFSSDACDPSGFGEGQTFLGSAVVTTNRAGIKYFRITLPVTIPQGALITATATDPAGNTSEFSQCFGPIR